jgi:8-oxo-dGTP diphosphatase
MTGKVAQRIVHVAVGVIVDDAGQVLIALRPEGVHQGGLWEFPGGKCEPGERVEDALRRELHEELGITVLRQQPLCLIRHHYGDKEVLLDVHRVDRFAGMPVGREGQPIRWVNVDSLEPTQFPAANLPIIQRLRLPRMVAITGAARSEQDFFDRFTRLLEQSPSLVQLRCPELDKAALLERAMRCMTLCRRHGVRLQLNADPSVIVGLDVDGLHVNARSLMTLQQRPVADSQLFSASCHDLAELQQAEALRADFVYLSPVAATASHPGQAVLGWQTFSALAAAVRVPIFALGGLDVLDLDSALEHGAAGIAGISAFWPLECESSHRFIR